MTAGSHTTEPPLLRAEDLSARVGGRTLFQGLSLDIVPGGVVALTGPNGAGKSTLLRILLGLLRPDRGRVVRARGLALGFVPQLDPSDSGIPFPAVSVVSQGIPWPARTFAARAVRAALDEVGFRAPPTRRYDRLSGGERRRVLLARALVTRPSLLVLDEPTAGVDVAGEREVIQIVEREVRERNVGVLWVCHGLHDVEADADCVIRLGEGG